jgi:hypothetical protein
MAPQVIQCEQGGDQWRRARMGIVTMSEAATVMASGKDGGASKTRKTYMMKLAGEILTGKPMASYSNADMERGKVMEPEIRAEYAAFHATETPEQVGFVINGPKGCSPDSLIGKNGALEIKSAFPHILIDILSRDQFPAEHKAQCQGNLWVLEREWIDIAIGWTEVEPGFEALPLFVKRAYREDGYIANLAGKVDEFNDELVEVVEKIRRYGATAQRRWQHEQASDAFRSGDQSDLHLPHLYAK